MAVQYRRMLDASDPERTTQNAIGVFDLAVRSLALVALISYLSGDTSSLNDQNLNRLLVERLPRPTLGTWKQILFTALSAYRGNRDLCFMPELYDLYWDTSGNPPRRRVHVEKPYDKVIELRNNLAMLYYADREVAASAHEAGALVREVLLQVQFLTNYELVLVIGKGTEGEYSYISFVGEHPTAAPQTIGSTMLLQTGYLYLRRNDGALLPLYPWLIYPQDTSTGDVAVQMWDIAIFNTFTRTTVTYLAFVGQRTLQERDPAVLAPLLAVLEGLFNRTPPRLPPNWELLCRTATHISESRFGEARSRFQSDTYLQRKDMAVTFQDYLTSVKHLFLLLGRSGAGKTSFVISMADDLASEEDASVLLYDGARLNSKIPLRQTVSRDFSELLRLDNGGDLDLIRSIQDLPGIGDRKFVLFIDAINENANPGELLRRVCDFVEQGAQYPWLKVVLTSRTASWQHMRRGVKLPEHLFYRPTSEDSEPGVELRPLTLGWELQPFGRDELQQAYEKYKTAYDLQTPYEELAPEVRHLITDPLTLKLFASTFRGTSVPQGLRPDAIYQLWFNDLVSNARVHQQDLLFLERELVPLMISEGHYSNHIDADQLAAATTASGWSLPELIWNDDLLSDGRATNQSFRNLVDAGILTVIGHAPDYEITFRYERLFDYFAGRRLYELAGAETNRAEYFSRLIRMTD
jgi:hypothetical protein